MANRRVVDSLRRFFSTKLSGSVPLRPRLVLTGLILAIATATACSSTNFNSSTGSKAAENGSGTNGTGANGLNGNGTNGADGANGGGSLGGTNNGANGGGGGANSGANGGGALGANIAQNGGQCSPTATPIDYNIMFIFDKTGSQTITDPSVVRRSGALQFLNTFTNYVATYSSAVVYMSVLAFNTQSIREGTWTLLNATSSATIEQQIVAATSDPNGDTAYSPVLTDAASYFAQINQQPNAAMARNYVIFLTDGLPNADSPSAITNALNTLVNSYNVAMIAVATGSEVPANGTTEVQSLALPMTPSKFPDHVGHYYRAASATDIANVWSQIVGQIGACSATANGLTPTSGTTSGT